eukprot:scaffold15702_cov66-Phaeocystis_antarctica.AAC.7
MNQHVKAGSSCSPHDLGSVSEGRLQPDCLWDAPVAEGQFWPARNLLTRQTRCHGERFLRTAACWCSQSSQCTHAGGNHQPSLYRAVSPGSSTSLGRARRSAHQRREKLQVSEQMPITGACVIYSYYSRRVPPDSASCPRTPHPQYPLRGLRGVRRRPLAGRPRSFAPSRPQRPSGRPRGSWDPRPPRQGGATTPTRACS